MGWRAEDKLLGREPHHDVVERPRRRSRAPGHTVRSGLQAREGEPRLRGSDGRETKIGAMVRLMGLPRVERYPIATVVRRDDRFEIVFAGTHGDHTIDVPLRLLGALDDIESVELRLLADLQRLGYEVTRAPPT